MLGCHDFCGYYDWTFHHVRQTFGEEALRQLWSEAIGADAQQAYLAAAVRDGLRGLLNIWTKTGEDEHCDWTFTLDEERNVLRWDMRNCPSKGFLLQNDLNADADYCDHCIGWIAPVLAKAGIEVAAHEHNHRGQCWAEMRVCGKAHATLDLSCDIRKDARWQEGFIDTFKDGTLVSDRLDDLAARTVLTDSAYADGVPITSAAAVIVGENEAIIRRVVSRYLATLANDRPLLLHAYFPRGESIDFTALGLSRPSPLLPILLRAGVYEHIAGAAHPLVDEQRDLLISAVTRLNAG